MTTFLSGSPKARPGAGADNPGRRWTPALLGRFWGQFRALEGGGGGDIRPIPPRIALGSSIPAIQ
jgi:hypothetical protein